MSGSRRTERAIMIVGPSMLSHLIKQHGLVYPEPIGPITRDSVDLRIGQIMKHSGGATLRTKSRDIGIPDEIQPQDGAWNLEPNQFYMARTVEMVNMPTFLAATGTGRSTMMRSGLIVTMGYIDPGYSGYIHFGIQTPGPLETVIEFEFPAVQLIFHMAEVVAPYDGKYQGGNMAPK